MPTGTVKRWNDEKGFGFIAPDDGSEDIFVHRTVLGGGAEYLDEDAKVEFETRWDDRKGKYAAASCSVLGGGGGSRGCGGGGGKSYGAAKGGGKSCGKSFSPYGSGGGGGGVCRNFQNYGECKFGDNCRFSHS
mmetsp:Transcript_7477/g.18861  ORF Transcript_7477/g.18861 Transcript_7477/m.18861 type:complete len:133 (-) Transcript_7477:211-609(-)